MTDREHFRRILRPFISVALTLAMAASCSRPASYEQFIKAEDAVGGVYEFALPASLRVPGEDTAFDIFFYTSPLKDALQLEIVAEGLCETVWFPAGEHRALYRSGVVFSGSGGQAADSALLRNPIRENASLAACPPDSSLFRNPIRENASLAACPTEEVILRIKVADPPEDFRGLGIICKRNNGTR